MLVRLFKKSVRVGSLAAAIGVFVISQNSLTVSALTQAQKDTILSGARYFNTEEDGAINCTAGTPGSTIKGSSVFFIGDSLTRGMADSGGLNQKVIDAGGTVAGIEATTGISVPASVDTIQKYTQEQKAKLAGAAIVVIALGTNDGGRDANMLTETFSPRVKSMIATVKSINSGAQIYWMNTYKDGSPQGYAGINSAIDSQSSTLGYKVIDWNTEAKNNNSKYAPFDPDLKVHPSNYDALASFVTKSLSGTNAQVSESGSCVCTASSLTGNDNKAKIWNYFTQTKGLSAESTAGLMGNLQSESASTWDPRVVQGTPPTFSNTVPRPLDGNTGYGIAQWTIIARKERLIKLADDSNRSESDLSLQLDLIWYELENYFPDVLNVLRQSNTGDLQTPTYKVLTDFEAPKDIEGNKPVRLNYAKGIFAEFGSGQADSSGTGSGCSSGSETGIVNTDGYAYPVAPLNKTPGKPCPSYPADQNAVCHAEPQYAFDFMRPGGTAVYAVHSGIFGRVNTSYGGVPGCTSINLFSDDGWKYWYGHLQNPLPFVVAGNRVEAGQKIAEVASFGGSACYGGGTHLHLDRGYPQGTNGGGGDLSPTTDARRDPTFIPFLQKLYDELPN